MMQLVFNDNQVYEQQYVKVSSGINKDSFWNMNDGEIITFIFKKLDQDNNNYISYRQYQNLLEEFYTFKLKNKQGRFSQRNEDRMRDGIDHFIKKRIRQFQDTILINVSTIKYDIEHGELMLTISEDYDENGDLKHEKKIDLSFNEQLIYDKNIQNEL